VSGLIDTRGASIDPWRMHRARLLVAGLSLAATFFVGCEAPTDSASQQAQPPVIVVQAPPDQAATAPAVAGAAAVEGANAGYAGLAWQAVNQAQPNANADPNAEPYDVVALLREFDPQITDPPNDAEGDAGHDDILSALSVMDEQYLYGRIVTRSPMRGDDVREVRFWIEQQPNMATVEVKVGTRDRPCELSDIKAVDQQSVVNKCFWAGNALDFRIPLKDVPASIDTTKPFWVSGFQTCCTDAERNKPFDGTDSAQEVWRVAGLASEVETK
jgi:hypothetical protein